MAVLDRITELLTAPEPGVVAPSRARIEDTLTAGYAPALALAAECWRLERRLGEVARRADGDDAPGFAAELAALSARLTSADGELARLRGLLGTLRERARTARGRNGD